jgi:hypothetical protein
LTALVMLVLVAGPAGCGGSRGTRHASRKSAAGPCRPAPLRAIAAFLSVPAGAVSQTASTGNNAMPQCTYEAPVAHAGRVSLTANVDNGPQPYFRLERTQVEEGQVFTPSRIVPAPVAISGLGLEADWFPQQQQLMATDGRILVTVGVSWRHAPQRRRVALDEAVARSYLAAGAGAHAKSFPG